MVTSPPYRPSVHGHVRARPGGVAKYNNRYSADPANLAHTGLDYPLNGVSLTLSSRRSPAALACWTRPRKSRFPGSWQ